MGSRCLLLGTLLVIPSHTHPPSLFLNHLFWLWDLIRLYLPEVSARWKAVTAGDGRLNVYSQLAVSSPALSHRLGIKALGEGRH